MALTIRDAFRALEDIKDDEVLTEAPVYDLRPEHDNRKSFYGKVQVDERADGTKVLYSYNTPVAMIKDGKVTLGKNWRFSPTTLRHVKEFLKQNGFEAGTSAEIADKYEIGIVESLEDDEEEFEASIEFRKVSPEEYLKAFHIEVNEDVLDDIRTYTDLADIIDTSYIFNKEKVSKEDIEKGKKEIEKYFDGEETEFDLSDSPTGIYWAFSEEDAAEHLDDIENFDEVEIVEIEGIDDILKFAEIPHEMEKQEPESEKEFDLDDIEDDIEEVKQEVKKEEPVEEGLECKEFKLTIPEKNMLDKLTHGNKMDAWFWIDDDNDQIIDLDNDGKPMDTCDALLQLDDGVIDIELFLDEDEIKLYNDLIKRCKEHCGIKEGLEDELEKLPIEEPEKKPEEKPEAPAEEPKPEEKPEEKKVIYKLIIVKPDKSEEETEFGNKLSLVKAYIKAQEENEGKEETEKVELKTFKDEAETTDDIVKFLKESKLFKKATQLNESELYNINSDEDIEKAKKVAEEEPNNIEKIVDVDAKTVAELKDSYIGNVILQCPVCKTLVYKKPDALVQDENNEELYNVEEPCPHCGAEDGYELVGQVASLDVEAEVEETTGKEEVEGNENEDDLHDEVEIDADVEKNELEFESLDTKSFDTLVNRYAKNIYENVNDFKTTFVENKKYYNVDILCNEEFNDGVIERNVEIYSTPKEIKQDVENYVKGVYGENFYKEATEKGAIKVEVLNKKDIKERLNVKGIIKFNSGKSKKTEFIFETHMKTVGDKLKFKGLNETFSKDKKSFLLTGMVEDKKFICESLNYNYSVDVLNESKQIRGKVTTLKEVIK